MPLDAGSEAGKLSLSLAELRTALQRMPDLLAVLDRMRELAAVESIQSIQFGAPAQAARPCALFRRIITSGKHDLVVYPLMYGYRLKLSRVGDDWSFDEW